MCDPTAMMVLQIASAGMKAFGAMQESKARKQEAEYNAALNRRNAEIAERNAAEVEKQGKADANRYRANVRRLQADQTVGLAGQGVDVAFGSSVDLLADTAELGERDALTIENNASRDAYNKRVEASNFKGQANLLDTKAANESPLMAGVSSLLSSSGSVADKWSRRKTPSPGGGTQKKYMGYTNNQWVGYG